MRPWRHSLGTQLATLGVLTATFVIVVFLLSIASNFQRVIAIWGEKVQIAIYLDDSVGAQEVDRLTEKIKKDPAVAEVDYISKQKAAESFRGQMASYAPDLLNDPEFATPFPAGLNIRLKETKETRLNLDSVAALANKFRKLPGVEDVSYGQSWLKNYAAFVSVMRGIGFSIGLVLIFGATLIVGNSIRNHIAARREEIEILELIGATSGFIRRPYLFEGAFLMALAAAMAVAINGAFFSWQIGLLKQSLIFSRVAHEFQFLSVPGMFSVVLTAALMGVTGAWLTAYSINSGWAAARRLAGQSEAAKEI